MKTVMSDTDKASDIFTEMLRIQGEAARQVMESVLPGFTTLAFPNGIV